MFSAIWFRKTKITGQVALLFSHDPVLFYHKYLCKKWINDETPENKTFNWACSGSLFLLLLWKTTIMTEVPVMQKLDHWFAQQLSENIKYFSFKRLEYQFENICSATYSKCISSTLWNPTRNLSSLSLCLEMQTFCVSFSTIWKYSTMVKYLKG